MLCSKPRRRWEAVDILRARMLQEGYPLADLTPQENRRVWVSLAQRRRRSQLQVILGWDDILIEARVRDVRRQYRQVTGKR